MADQKLPGILVVLSGPAGVGKTTVGEQLLSRVPDMVRIVTATTRAPRGQERDGVDYHFWDVSSFQSAVSRGQMLEWAEVHGNYYGTPLNAVVDALRNGSVVLLIIDVDGARKIRQVDSSALLVFLEPPGAEELERRLRERATEDEEKIRRRLARAQRELEAAPEYDARCVNTNVADCVRSVERLIDKRRKEMADAHGAESSYPGLAAMIARLDAAARQ